MQERYNPAYICCSISIPFLHGWKTKHLASREGLGRDVGQWGQNTGRPEKYGTAGNPTRNQYATQRNAKPNGSVAWKQRNPLPNSRFPLWLLTSSYSLLLENEATNENIAFVAVKLHKFVDDINDNTTSLLGSSMNAWTELSTKCTIMEVTCRDSTFELHWPNYHQNFPSCQYIPQFTSSGLRTIATIRQRHWSPSTHCSRFINEIVIVIIIIGLVLLGSVALGTQDLQWSNFPVDDLSVCRCVRASVGLSSALWKNSGSDLASWLGRVQGWGR